MLISVQSLKAHMHCKIKDAAIQWSAPYMNGLILEEL